MKSMPSRTRALLYGEKYDEIVKSIADSIKMLCDNNVSYIVLVCGTAHYFLEDVYKLVPEARDKVLNIVEVTGEYIANNRKNNNNIFVIAAEGTLKNKVYDKVIEPIAGVNCISPGEDEYTTVRKFIEYIKKNQLNIFAIDEFVRFISERNTKEVILGCTEFSALVDYCYTMGSLEQKNILDSFTFYDPVDIVLKKLKEILQ